MQPDDALDALMLTLSAISYRGWAEPYATSSTLHARMAPLLARLAPDWQIVWGPASFRAGLNGFDDAAMYAARHREHPSQLAIVVRGTNPIAAFDWFFGDLMVAHQLPWPYGSPPEGAKISFSTALGLSILQHLRWSETPDAAPDRDTPAARDDTIAVLRQLRGHLLRKWETALASGAAGSDRPVGRWMDVLRRQLAPEVTRGLQALESALGTLTDDRIDPLQLLLDSTVVEQSFAGGRTLREWLRDQTSPPGRDAGRYSDPAPGPSAPLDIYVTGHSKGGALCVALATWLADTQGDAVPAAEQWDPHRVATVHSYAFAGPTPGNGAFARHVNARLANRCHRIANHLDIVPRAWVPEEIDGIATLYRSMRLTRLGLTLLSTQVAKSIRTLDYQHAGTRHVKLSGVERAGALPAQLVHQHLDGYLEQLGFPPDVRAATFFDVIPAAPPDPAPHQGSTPPCPDSRSCDDPGIR